MPEGGVLSESKALSAPSSFQFVSNQALLRYWHEVTLP
jgi:hypothetical protein